MSARRASAARGAPADRRRTAAVAGHRGDEATARAHLDDRDGSVRATALGALARMGRLRPADLDRALASADASLRRRAAELAAAVPGVPLVPLLADDDPMVVEVAAWALGEREQADPDVVAALAGVATGHDDPMCREAAVAALGAIGDPAGLPAVLAATRDRPAVRRRAVIALAPFDGPDVDEALRRAATDRDWQTRQAAEDLLDD